MSHPSPKELAGLERIAMYEHGILFLKEVGNFGDCLECSASPAAPPRSTKAGCAALSRPTPKRLPAWLKEATPAVRRSYGY
jgi:hypothetical protein